LSDGRFASVSTAEVTVNVIDANDFRPEFKNSVYRATIDENLPPMTSVQIISATDGDRSSVYSQIREYKISEDDVPFYIETKGRRTFVATNVSLDYEQGPRMYIFHIHAYDMGGLRSDVPAEMRITVRDVNDCNPTFERPYYSEEVSENENAGTRVLKVTATDCDISSQFRRIRYKLSNDANNLFRINAVSGVITTDRTFDYEANHRLFEFSVLVQDAARGRFRFPVYVNISIADVNEYIPQFTNLPAFITVPEGQQSNTTVYNVMATDRDAGPVFGNVAAYRITQHSPVEAPFRIDLTTGIIYLTSEIDYENGTTEFNLTIMASDEGGNSNTSLLFITLGNINDERPLFYVTEYSVDIAENNYPANRSGWPDNALLQLQAEDPDELALTFSLHSEDKTLFAVTEDGYVVLKQPLDFERSTSYSLQISLNDSLFTSEEVATVNITVINENDIAPVFFSCLTGCCNDSDVNFSIPVNITVRENTIGLMDFSIKACDYDNDPLQYYINSTEMLPLKVLSNGSLLVTDSLDYEKKSVYTFNIVANDSVHTSSNVVIVTLFVLNVDDGAPVFRDNMYSAEFPENRPRNRLKLLLSAIDPDDPSAELRYSIDRNVPFSVRPVNRKDHTAEITNRRSFDSEVDPLSYSFYVIAMDSASKSSDPVLVIINITDQNEFSPSFAKKRYTKRVAENDGTQVILDIMATDGDSSDRFGRVQYSLPKSVPFTVDTAGRLINTRPLDADTGKVRYNFRVRAIDGGGESDSAEVTIIVNDINDNAPEFNKTDHQIDIYENSPVNSRVLTLFAIDRDHSSSFNQIADYSLSTNETDLPFTISSSGVITTTRNLDYENDHSVYIFSVSASDMEGKSSITPANVTINLLNIPDTLPLFASMFAESLSEDSKPGVPVIQLHSTSNDEGVVAYRVVDNDIPFAVNESTGLITLSRAIDFETQQMYNFTVISYIQSDPSLASYATVLVSIDNVNDNAPEIERTNYTAELHENLPVGSLRVIIVATDIDLEAYGMISRFVLKNSNDLFHLIEFSAADGSVVLTNSIAFDAERDELFNVKVHAVDGGGLNSSVVDIFISIVDVNDNKPTITAPFTFALLPENSIKNIFNFSASDLDKSLQYSLVARYEISGSVPFVAYQNGSIFNSHELDYDEETTLYEFEVRAVDGGGLVSDAIEVRVQLVDENDNAPLPIVDDEWPVKYIKIEWDTEVSHEAVFSLLAEDGDIDDQLYYFIDPSSVDLSTLPFGLPSRRRGEFVLQQKLSQLITYNFTVVIMDRDPMVVSNDTRTLIWQVSVAIIDSNSPPYFAGSQLEWKLTLPEGSFDNTTLFFVVAEDNDLPGSENSRIAQYRIITSTMIPFEVNSQGHVRQVEPLSLCVQSSYNFIIQAVDGSGLVTATPISVNITVKDTNNFVPQLNGSSVFYITELNPSWKYDFAVDDPDCGMSGMTACSLSPIQWFVVNATTCQLSLVDMLYYDHLNHTFTIALKVEDHGSPPLLTEKILTIHILPANNHPVLFDLSKMQLKFVEEGDPINILQGVSISDADKVSNFTVNVTLGHAPLTMEGTDNDSCSSEQLNCLPGAINLQRSSSRFLRIRPTISTFTLMTWLKINDIRSQSTLCTVYSTARATARNSQLDVFIVEGRTLTIVYPINARRNRRISLPLPTLKEDTWYHFALSIISGQLHVLINGNTIVYNNLKNDFFNEPDRSYIDLQTYTTMTNIEFQNPFLSLGTNVDIFQAVGCTLNDGEVLDISELPHISSKRLSVFHVIIKSSDATELSSFLSLLKYGSLATEPRKLENTVTVNISDGVHEQSRTVVIHTVSVNDHEASFNVNSNQTEDFVVSNNKTNYVTIAPDAVFCDKDTIQMVYSASITFRTGLNSLCDKIQRAIDVKLRQCGVLHATNFLPHAEWNLGWLDDKGVTKFGREINRVGYHFDGTGGLVDLNQYTFVPDLNKMSFTLWTLFNDPGYITTIGGIISAQETFLVGLYGTHSSIEIHLFQDSDLPTPNMTLTWPWKPVMNQWVHVAVKFNFPIVEMFINGELQSINFTLPKQLPVLQQSVLLITAGGRWTRNRETFFDSFSGVIAELAVIPNTAIEYESLMCVLSCSEQLSVPQAFLPPDNGIKITTDVIDGHLEISGKMSSKEMETLIKSITYTNVHPYAMSGNREIQFTVNDGLTSLPLQELILTVVSNRHRTITLQRIDRIFVTRSQLRSGFTPLRLMTIVTDRLSTDTVDSAFVDITDQPCYMSGHCRLRLDQSIVDNSPLQMRVGGDSGQPGIIVLHGIGSVSVYHQLLRQIVLISSRTTTLTSLHVEVSDYNRLVTSIKRPIITLV